MSHLQRQSERPFPTGWLVVLGLVLLTPLLHAFIITNTARGAAAGRALVIGSAAIGLRAVFGIWQRRASRAWVAYALLYPGLILLTAAFAVIFSR